MNTKNFILTLIVFVVAFTLITGGAAIYASAKENRYQESDAPTTTQQIVINKYSVQQQRQAYQGQSPCNQQVTGYSNYEPQVECKQSGASATQYPSTNGNVKVVVNNYGGSSYYPYRRYDRYRDYDYRHPRYGYPKYYYHQYPYDHTGYRHFQKYPYKGYY